MFFNAEQTEGAVGSVVSTPGVSGGSQPSQHLSPQQFGKKAGPAEGGAAEAGAGEAAGGAAAAGGAEAGAASVAELAPLLLL